MPRQAFDFDLQPDDINDTERIMRNRHGIHLLSVLSATVALFLAAPTCAKSVDDIETVEIGQVAPDIELQPLEGNPVKLSKFTRKGPVVLVVLRGFPGYQCPACSGQVAELRSHAKEFEALKTNIVLVYPGPEANLKARAREFLEGTKLPPTMTLVIDPNYTFTKTYGLRWDAPAETAYPSTFVLDGDRKVQFRKLSVSHGDRAKAEDILAAVKKISNDNK